MYMQAGMYKSPITSYGGPCCKPAKCIGHSRILDRPVTIFFHQNDIEIGSFKTVVVISIMSAAIYHDVLSELVPCVGMQVIEAGIYGGRITNGGGCRENGCKWHSLETYRM
jgi:hypothetical protein